MRDIVDIAFSPSFGNRPSQLIGRDALLDEIEAGLREKAGSKNRSIIMLGQRGFGKTVLLWEIADRARELGYAVANPTAVREGLVLRIAERLAEDAGDMLGSDRLRVSELSAGIMGFSASVAFGTPASEPSPESRIEHIVRLLSDKGIGTLFLVDELQGNSADVRSLVGTYQELVGAGLNVAMVLAGLPSAVSQTLNDKVLTFLNRARKITLEPLRFGDVDAFFAEAFRDCGLSVPVETRRKISRYAGGSPYLMQLLGHYCVLYSQQDGHIDENALANAMYSAKEEFEGDVCATTLAPLSAGDIAYLTAMAHLGETPKTADVATKLGVSADYAQQYRRRLIDAGIIEAPARGTVTFSVPYLQDFLLTRDA